MDPDTLDDRSYVAVMAPLFEQAPRFLERLAAGRPYGSWERHFGAAARLVAELPDDERLELIDAHPRIGAPPGSVSAMSFVEQGYDRETATAEAEAERLRVGAELERLNDAYEAHFGFRFVIFVAGRSRAEIVPFMQAALTADPLAERERALADVVAIARDRAIKSELMTDHTAAG